MDPSRSKSQTQPTVLQIYAGQPMINPRRVCLFASFDPDSRIHSITLAYLEALRAEGCATIFVSTSAQLSASDRENLAKYCVEIVHRQNVGYDFYSWKVALARAGAIFDQTLPILITNDSILGPLLPLTELFQRIDHAPDTLWGLTESTELGVWHLQSYFLYIPAQETENSWFRDFWRSLKVKSDKTDIIRSYELGFTKAALDHGIKCRSLFPRDSVVEAAKKLGTNFQYHQQLKHESLNLTLFMWDILIRDFAFPFIKAELIRQDRFESRSMTNWLNLLPPATSSTIRRALIEFEEASFWRGTDPSHKVRLHRSSRLRSFLDKRPYLRNLIHRTRLFRADVKSIITRLSHGQWRVVYGNVKQWIRKCLIKSLLANESSELERKRSREQYFADSIRQLETFLFSDGHLDLTPLQPARLTIVLVLYNRAELTYRCLRSLAAIRSEWPFEVLMIDNQSHDKTGALIERIRGIRYVRNSENVGFLLACNQASDLVTTEFMLFLNNDTEVHPGSLAVAAASLDQDPTIGAVGARIILPNGCLQEAGNIIWNDGTCVGYARDQEAFAPVAMFEREVDYCSGAFLMTRSALFKQLGGFDIDYAPAYYEETDFCIRVWKAGKRVVYQPRAAITHVEFGSTEASSQAIDLMQKNRAILCKKHADFLSNKPPRESNPIANRITHSIKRDRLLILDDRIPNPRWGAGYPRAAEILRGLMDQGYSITIGCTEFFDYNWHQTYLTLSKEIEVIPLLNEAEAKRFFAQRFDIFDVIWCSRPRNLEFLIKAYPNDIKNRRFTLVYDAEAFFADRAIHEARTFGLPTEAAEKQLRAEIDNAKNADLIVAVSEQDQIRWRDATSKPTYVIGHSAQIDPTGRSFSERGGLLCVGSLHGLDSPNGDALAWFMREAMPHLRSIIGDDVLLNTAGYLDKHVKHLLSRQSLRNFHLIGAYNDPKALFDQYRVVIIPTRYAAGIPQKAFDAAIHGVPTVCSPLIASQLGWQDGKQCLIGSIDNPKQFADACKRLLTDEGLWQDIRAGAVAYLRDYDQRFSIKTGLPLVLSHLKRTQTSHLQ